MAGKGMSKAVPGRADPGKLGPPPSPRLRITLATAEDCRRELARLYREARGKRLDVADASRLANILQIMSRLIENSDLEARILALEEVTKKGRR